MSDIRNINGVEVDVTTVMDKSVRHIPSYDEALAVKQGVVRHIDDFFPNTLDEADGIRAMFSVENGLFWNNKGWIIEAMKRHPSYNGNLQIVLRDTPMCRYIDKDVIQDFFRFALRNIGHKMEHYNPEGKVISSSEARDASTRISLLKGLCAKIYHRAKTDVIRNKATQIFLRLEHEDEIYSSPKMVYRREIDALDAVKRYVIDNSTHLADDSLAEKLNELIPEGRFRGGQKISRIVGKIAKRCGLNKVTDFRTETFYDQSGVEHSRTKDIGWNYQFARFCDAVNPLTINATAVISVHPVDFLRMSFGKDWSSCMTTDKQNRRCCDNNYHGMYCGGTLSYMLDISTVLMYFLPSEYTGNSPEWEDKLKRCNFHLGEDKIVQGRVYPDGRDGGEKSLAGDMRAIMQKVVSEIFGEPNYWDNRKGVSACDDVICSEGVHYRDYQNYNDCNVSYWKRIDGYINENYITVGEMPICPECGRRHENEENIFCEECAEGGYVCTHCGHHVSESDVYWIDGEPYCPDCVTYCEDCDEIVLTEDITRTYEGRYVCPACLEQNYTHCDDVDAYVNNDNVVETEEGHCYYCDGSSFAECYECGEIHDRDQMIYDEETDEYYCRDCYRGLIEAREAARADQNVDAA